MANAILTVANWEQAAGLDTGIHAKAILNILGDFSDEKARLHDAQVAMLNILQDAEAEKRGIAAAQKAALNILEDFGQEKAWLAEVQKASLNVLEDFGAEKGRLAEIQKAMLNILDDSDAARNGLQQINQQMAREIEERKRAEDALRVANKELEAFSYSVSHDLRAPLRAIDGFTQALVEEYREQLDAEGRDWLERVRAGTQRMGQLIDDLLEFSRITRAELRLENVDVSALAQEAVDELRKLDPGRIVRVDIAPGLEARADRRLLRIAFDNLLGNAWKFTSRQSEAQIEFCAIERDGQRTYIVRDNGVGFDMAYAERLFGVFQRLHDARDFPGTGIGLATVQRVINKHGGRIWADAAVGRGATFYFTL